MSGRTHGDRKLRRPAAKATAKPTPTLAAERDRRDYRRPASVRTAFGCGRDVHRAHDLAREEPLFAPLVPGLIRFEWHAEHSRQHRRREIFRVLAGHSLTLAVAVMLGDVAVM